MKGNTVKPLEPKNVSDGVGLEGVQRTKTCESREWLKTSIDDFKKDEGPKQLNDLIYNARSFNRLLWKNLHLPCRCGGAPKVA